MDISLQKILNTVGLFFLIAMNMMAVLLPLGNKTTGELSDLYPNLFVPAGFTFAIWSIIYILLFIFVGYLWIRKNNEKALDSIGILFFVNALANGMWLVFWHYEYVISCILLMLIMLSTLIIIYNRLDIQYFGDSTIPWQTSVPISVYMGWISVATIANVTVVFVNMGYTSLGFSGDVWASIVLLIAVGLALRLLYVKKDLFFAAVVAWAAFGIYSKRVADIVSNDVKIEHTSYISIYILCIGIILTIVQLTLKRKKSI